MYSGWRGEDVEGLREDGGARAERDCLVVVVRHEVEPAIMSESVQGSLAVLEYCTLWFYSLYLTISHSGFTRFTELFYVQGLLLRVNSEGGLYRRPAPVLA